MVMGTYESIEEAEAKLAFFQMIFDSDFPVFIAPACQQEKCQILLFLENLALLMTDFPLPADFLNILNQLFNVFPFFSPAYASSTVYRINSQKSFTIHNP